LWWAITTLTTTGYGDVVPVTVFGRMLGGLMMIAGIIVFGLLAGILATGFSQEVRRREFLRNWDLVKQVPIFHMIGPGLIADLAALLRPRELPPRAVLWRRGDPGDAMYFIVSGEVAVLIEPPLRLGAGDFFGELALLHDKPRTATVVTTQSCQLLELDIADFRALASKTPQLMRSIELEAGRRQESNSAGNP
jgi:voltage-gated potassium channel